MTALRIDQREVRAPPIGKKPHRRGAAAAPVVHRAEPLVLQGRFDDMERAGIGGLQRPQHGVMAVHGSRRLHARALNGIGNRSKRRMRIAAVRDAAGNRHDQRADDERHRHHRRESSGERKPRAASQAIAGRSGSA